jgi:hypothetical protein
MGMLGVKDAGHGSLSGDGSFCHFWPLVPSFARPPVTAARSSSDTRRLASIVFIPDLQLVASSQHGSVAQFRLFLQ